MFQVLDGIKVINPFDSKLFLFQKKCEKKLWRYFNLFSNFYLFFI
jgi:hypothetical protein